MLARQQPVSNLFLGEVNVHFIATLQVILQQFCHFLDITLFHLTHALNLGSLWQAVHLDKGRHRLTLRFEGKTHLDSFLGVQISMPVDS